MLLYHGLALALGYILDLCLGDPQWLYHPICVIGNLIGVLRKRLPTFFSDTPSGQRKAGVLLVVIVCLSALVIPGMILLILYRWNIGAGFALETFWCYQLLAGKSLKTESMKVYEKVKNENLEGARQAVSMIVGRDTKNLTMEGVVKATVETVAENTSDGVVAPMIYMAIGGVPLMFLYKAINTMDSMIGYKDEKYLHLGRCAARLDDVANYIPARICALFMILAAYVTGNEGANARKIFLRDRYNHASPNSAQTESVMAGALGVQLAGSACYFGKVYEKPTIGDSKRPIFYEDIKTANKLMYVTAGFTCVILVVLLIFIWALT